MDTEKKKPGPAKGSKYSGRRLDARLDLALEPEALEIIRKAADAEGISVSLWVRRGLIQLLAIKGLI
jgi:predicted HicB family RNase H-like nuclease